MDKMLFIFVIIVAVFYSVKCDETTHQRIICVDMNSACHDSIGLSCFSNEYIAIKWIGFQTSDKRCGPCHLNSSGLMFNDTSDFSDLLYEACTLKTACNTSDWRIEGTLHAQWYAAVNYTCVDTRNDEQVMDLCSNTSKHLSQKGHLIYQQRHKIKYLKCSCSISQAEEVIVREYRPYHNKTCTDSILHINEKTYLCNKTKHNYWENSIYNINISGADTISVTLERIGNLDPEKLWLSIKGIKAQINCTRLELETSSKTPTTKSTISISRTTNISPTSTIYTTDNSSASLITASINKEETSQKDVWLEIGLAIGGSLILVIAIVVTICVLQIRKRKSFISGKSSGKNKHCTLKTETELRQMQRTSDYTDLPDKGPLKPTSFTRMPNTDFEGKETDTYSHLENHKQSCNDARKSSFENNYSHLQTDGVQVTCSNAETYSHVHNKEDVYNTTSTESTKMQSADETYSHVKASESIYNLPRNGVSAKPETLTEDYSCLKSFGQF